MAGPGICVLYLADTRTSKVHPVFNPVAHYGYLLPNMYLFIADIANTAPKKRYVGSPLLGAGGFDTICTAVYDRCDSSTSCRLCRLEPAEPLHQLHNLI